MKFITTKMRGKMHEAVSAVVPIIAIVLVLSLTIAPVSPSIILSFLFGAVLVMLGMMLFTLGAETSMTPMGEKVGAKMTQTKNLFFICFISLILGVIITISEPDLQVLAGLVPSIPNRTLILAVAAGVGVFLVIAILRILLRIPLSILLILLYIGAFVLMFYVPEDFRAIAFDSGGVTTGPMTVPFIMALGVGIASIRNDRSASDDSFGLVALCSVGPILAVLVLGMIFRPGDGDYNILSEVHINDTVELRRLFTDALPHYFLEISISLLPIVIFFGLFQIFSLRLNKRSLGKIVVGLVYTYFGLVLFLTGANVGFMPTGIYLGSIMASSSLSVLIIPLGALMGFFIVKAEPAVYVLNHQVEEITEGAISAKAMGTSLSLGVAASVALAMIRVLTGIPILYFLIPGYVIALGLSFIVPKIFTAIAFDSGGVASGPMTATFLLPLAQGACVATGGNLAADAFGVVAMVAMTPLITIQILGLISMIKNAKRRKANIPAFIEDEDGIIEL